MPYRPEIDGLRALAVLSVIGFHAGFPAFKGGFFGVDVFFVISGYLIAGWIGRDVARGSFSWRCFYRRRVRRILPAQLVVMACCLPFALAWMTPAAFETFATSLLAALALLGNVFFWQQTGYFHADAEMQPLLHLWSLAVEMQFYLVFPLVFVGLWRLFGPRLATWMLGLAGVLSFGFSVWGSQHVPAFTFYMPFGRFWELLAGALCARLEAWAVSLPPPPRLVGARMLRAHAGTLGLGLVLGACLWGEALQPVPGPGTLVPVLGTVLVLRYAHPDTHAGALLASRPLVGLGLISYSAYLWHQPLFAFARIYHYLPPSPALMAALAALALGLAALTWRFIEQPCRYPATFRHGRARRLLLVAGALAGIGVLVAGVGGRASAGFPERIPAPARVVLRQAEVEKQRMQGPCKQNLGDALKPHPRAGCYHDHARGEAERFRVALIGDSHAGSLAHTLKARLATARMDFYTAIWNGCTIVPGLYRRDKGPDNLCHRFSRRAFDYVKEAGYDAVILLGRWTLPVVGNRFDNGMGGKEPGAPVYADHIAFRDRAPQPLATRQQRVLQAYRAGIAELLAHMPVILVYPIPEAGWDVPTLLAKRIVREGEVPARIATAYRRYRRRNGAVLRLFDRLEHPDLRRLRPSSLLCQERPGALCLNSQGRVSFYADAHHLGEAGAERLVAALMARLRPLRAAALESGG